MPCAVRAVGFGGVEVDHSVFSAQVGADDEHVAGEDAEIGREGFNESRDLGIVGGAPLGGVASPVSTESPGGVVDYREAERVCEGEELVAAFGFARGAVGEDEADPSIDVAIDCSLMDGGEEGTGAGPPARGEPAEV